MATYGKTWWGKKWLETFNGIDCDNRLPRGRTYANTGRAATAMYIETDRIIYSLSGPNIIYG